MHPRFYEYYNQELTHLRESAAEFAREFPKIAGRLTMEGIECSDPYVERLLEGFSFLAARIQLKLDAEFPVFTQHLTEVVLPDYLAPLPSMAIVHLEPDYSESALARGFTVPRGTVMRGRMGGEAQTACEFRTAHELTLWPIEVAEAKFLSYPPEFPREMALPTDIKGAIKLRLRINGEATFDQLPLERLTFYLSGEEGVAARVYEHLFSSCLGIAVVPARRPLRWHHLLDASSLERVGFGGDEALLTTQRSFRGYRLLREYSAFPSRYLFFRLAGLREALSSCKAQEVEFFVLLGRADPKLESLVDAEHFKLNATPAINLFPKLADRIHLEPKRTEYHLLADRTRPMDFEIYAVTSVTGHGSNLESERHFRPLYATIDQATLRGDGFYALRREARLLSSSQKRTGARTSYIGTEIFLSLTDTASPPLDPQLKQLSVETLCTNRDLPILMVKGNKKGDFTPDTSLPVAAIRCLRGPTRPTPPVLEREGAWRLISHLSLNALSLTDTSPLEGAAALRQMLELYGIGEESPLRKQLEGIRSVEVKPIVRRMPTSGPVTMGRGLEINLTCDDRYFDGTSPFVLASVLEEFFSRHASINAFTETVLHVIGRGEIMRWKSRLGRRPVL
ncbi:MAG: type VI secretion system protein ImpG [Gallionellaceae bacterium]|nr:MAG: type VI secretion system protein ImpG [Gallionellaceae bacterium]